MFDLGRERAVGVVAPGAETWSPSEPKPVASQSTQSRRRRGPGPAVCGWSRARVGAGCWGDPSLSSLAVPPAGAPLALIAVAGYEGGNPVVDRMNRILSVVRSMTDKILFIREHAHSKMLATTRRRPNRVGRCAWPRPHRGSRTRGRGLGLNPALGPRKQAAASAADSRSRIGRTRVDDEAVLARAVRRRAAHASTGRRCRQVSALDSLLPINPFLITHKAQVQDGPLLEGWATG